jgi:ATP-dependent Lhr-like helicase
VLSRPAKATPFSFPIIVNRLRERLSSEKLEDRIRRMKVQLAP